MKFESEYEGPWASPKKLLAPKTGNWRYRRPVTNKAKCCRCGTCYLFCSSGCVAFKGDCFEVDMDYCKGCGTCARLCPARAIRMVREK